MLFFLLSRCLSTLSSSQVPVGSAAGLIFKVYDYNYGEKDLLTTNIVAYVDNYSDNYFDYNKIEGSFCAPSTGYWKTRITFRGRSYVKGHVGNLDDCGESSSCGDFGYWGTFTSGSVLMYKGQCYPIFWGNCLNTRKKGGTNKLEFSNDDSNWISRGDYIIASDKQRCLKGYYGNPCTLCTVDCNGNGYCGGMTVESKAENKCTCTSYTEDPFCTNPAVIPSTGKERGVRLSVVDKTGVIMEDNIYNSATINDINGAYASIELNFYVYCPQISNYQVRCISDISTIITVNDKAKGEVDSFSKCEKSEPNKETESITFSGNHNIVKVNIKGESGCTMFNHQFKLQWKFYRYYEVQNVAAEWVDIPERYFFHD